MLMVLSFCAMFASLCNMVSFSADIESKLRQIEEDPEGAGTAHLCSVTQKISGVANRAFEPLFERQVYRLSFLQSYFPFILIAIAITFLLGCTKVSCFVQAQAEKIRSVQGMLQRFRTLFNMPSAIRGNIRKGEYDLAVREYQKAKSIILPSHVPQLLNLFYLHLLCISNCLYMIQIINIHS